MGPASYLYWRSVHQDYDHSTLVCCLAGTRVTPLVSCQVSMGLEKENNSEKIRLAHLLLLHLQKGKSHKILLSNDTFIWAQQWQAGPV